MRGFDDLDPKAGATVTVARDDKAFAGAPFGLDRLGHPGRGFPGADDLGNMFQFYRDFEADFRRVRDPAVARALNPELQDFRAFVTRNKDRIPLT